MTKVDLFTSDMILDSLMLGEYPGKIIPEEQYKAEHFEGKTRYSFFDLELSTLRAFLDGRNFAYEIRDRKTGKYISRHEEITFSIPEDVRNN
jgi:hypothetical protein